MKLLAVPSLFPGQWLESLILKGGWWEVVVSVEIHPLDIEGYQSVPVEFAYWDSK